MSPTALGVLLVVAATVTEGFAQTSLKKSTEGANRELWIGLGIALFVVEIAIYTGALRLLDVSTAFPIGSLSFVTATLLSQWLLGETVTRMRWIGVCLILVGTGLIVAHA